MSGTSTYAGELACMESSYKWLWFARIAAVSLLTMHVVLVIVSSYSAYTDGREDTLISLASALAGVVVSTLLVVYKFGGLGQYSVRILKKTQCEYECIDGTRDLSRRYRNFKRARKAMASSQE